MTTMSIDDVSRRRMQMDAARRMGTQENLPEPSAAIRAIEDQLVAGEMTLEEALAAIREDAGRSA